MSIKFSMTGSVTLSGKAAKSFREQFIENSPLPSKAAQESLERGRKLLKQFGETGVIKVRVKN